MKYYIDCEFDGFEGPLMSMAIVSETGKSMYVVMNYGKINDMWVKENVHPIMFDVPITQIYPCILGATPEQLSRAIEMFLRDDGFPHIIADWPDDLKYFMAALITGPGTMVNLEFIKCSISRVDAYPTTLHGAVQHNAWWDAMALRHLLERKSS